MRAYQARHAARTGSRRSAGTPGNLARRGPSSRRAPVESAGALDSRGPGHVFADGFLAVRAPDEAQRKVAAYLEFLERHVLQPVRIDLYVLPPESARTLAKSVTSRYVQLPRVWWSSAITSVVIADGGGFVAGNSATPRGLLFVRVTRLPGGGADGSPFGAAFVPAAALLRQPEREPGIGFIHPSPSGIPGSPGREGIETGGGEPIGLGLFRSRLASEASRPSVSEPAGEFEVVGGSLLVRGGCAYRARAAELAQDIGRTLTTVVTVECRLGTVSGEEAAKLATRELAPETVADRIPVAAVAPCLAGNRFAFQANLCWQELPAAPEVFPTRLPEIGSLDQPRILAVRTRSAPILDSGRWTLYHASPVPGTDRHLVVLVRVTG